jgi:hypothetical protein
MADACVGQSSTTEIPVIGTAWGASTTAVAYASDAEVIDELIRKLDSHEFIFGLLMGLVCALGCALRELSNPNTPADPPVTRITPMADVGSEKIDNQHLAGEAETKTENSEVPPPPSDDANGKALFAAMTNLNDQLTTLHAALPPRTADSPVLGAQRPAFDVHARCTSGGVSGEPVRETERLCGGGRK